MNINKIIGYLLLFVGVAIIAGTLYHSYNIFLNKAAAPEIFKITKTEPFQKTKTQDIQKQMEEAVKEQISQLLPPDFLPRILNLIAWSVGAGVLILGAGQIAGLGIKLVKPG